MKMGVIQGRLSPPIEGFQECPVDWQKEFALLSELNLNHIEWIVTKKSFSANPIFTDDVSEYPISSICADNLVDAQITNKEYLHNNLIPLCEAAVYNNIANITIPLLEDSSMSDNKRRQAFCSLIIEIIDQYEALNFLFEAELGVPQLQEILSLSDRCCVTYDTGNITSCGFEHIAYLEQIFDRIKNVHLKDRTYDAQTVYPLMGDTNFKQIFHFLRKSGYNGLYTLQTARGKFGDETKTIKEHKRIMEDLYNEESI
jgi:hexulose-6-phosphate isomerase